MSKCGCLIIGGRDLSAALVLEDYIMGRVKTAGVIKTVRVDIANWLCVYERLRDHPFAREVLYMIGLISPPLRMNNAPSDSLAAELARDKKVPVEILVACYNYTPFASPCYKYNDEPVSLRLINAELVAKIIDETAPRDKPFDLAAWHSAYCKFHGTLLLELILHRPELRQCIIEWTVDRACNMGESSILELLRQFTPGYVGPNPHLIQFTWKERNIISFAAGRVVEKAAGAN
jgi:hypothetical protein